MTKPNSLNPLAEKVLERLAAHPETSEIVLGGYFALQHYSGYRTTHDIDAWWRSRASKAAEQAIRMTMAEVAAENDFQLSERRFGDTLSFELLSGGKKRFSFQIAVRSVTLEDPVTSAWPPLLIETLYDNAGSKMNALVNRGAPRDLLDIKHLCDENLLTPAVCWELWTRKNADGTVESAKQNLMLHILNLEARRPLDRIADSAERERARELRQWYRDTFLNA